MDKRDAPGNGFNASQAHYVNAAGCTASKKHICCSHCSGRPSSTIGSSSTPDASSADYTDGLCRPSSCAGCVFIRWHGSTECISECAVLVKYGPSIVCKFACSPTGRLQSY